MSKKSISKILICAMLISILPKTSFAEEEKVNTEAVSTKEKENKNEKEAPKVEENKENSTEKKAEAESTEKQNTVEAPKSEDKKEKSAEEVKPRSARNKREVKANFEGTVTFVGQWTGESRRKEDSTKNFTNADEKLGAPLTNPGLFRSIGKTFLGWSDKAPVGNGKLADGARLFSPEDKISTVFPDGIPADAKIYGVYFSLNDPETPLPDSTFGLGLSIVGGLNKFKLDGTEITIDKDKTSEEVLPDTKLAEEKDKNKDRKIIDNYTKKDDVNEIHEVIATSEFQTDPVISMLVYRDPHVGYVGPIFSNTYKDNEFKTDDGKTGYSYVDINVNLDNDLVVPEKIYLEFEGYAWRPLYVMGANKQVLNIFDPNSNADLGNTKDSFKSLVSSTNPKVTFGVNTNNNKNFTVRMIIRTGNEKIAESNITPDAGQSIAEKILQNMKLKVLSKKDLKTLLPGKTDAELNNNVLRITDEKAKELADTEGETTLKIKGYIQGNTMVNAGRISFLTLSDEEEIKRVDANTIALGYTIEKYNVTFTFISGTEGKDLPAEVAEKQPADKFGIENGVKETLENFADVKVDGGTWKFKGWSVDKNGVSEAVTNEATVDGDDLILVGEWIFVEDEKPVEPQNPEPQKPENPQKPEPAKPQKPQVRKNGELPKTNVSSAMSYVFLAIAGLGGAYISKKKDNE
ncbi:MAG: hypothetical protein HXL14_02415 [Parvimonas sp.]|nr:hypothetical protein [Parvimonas sp.]